MNQLNPILPHWGRDLLVVVLGLSLAFAVNFSQRFLIPGLFPTMPVVEHTSNTLEWRFDLRQLSDGPYYISAGRPTGPCSISLDGGRVATTMAPIQGTLQSITLGASFIKTTNGPVGAEITCEIQHGFPSGMTDTPSILPYTFGRSLQFYREFISIWLGVLAAMYLLLSVLTLAGPKLADPMQIPGGPAQASVSSKYGNSFVLFATVSLIYAASLSYNGWLFFSDSSATMIHILIRIAFSFSFILLANEFKVRQRPYHYVYGSLLALYLVTFFFSNGNADAVRALYKATHFIFGLTTLILWFDLKATRQHSRPISLFASFTLLWAFAQWSDTFSFLRNSPSYSAPVLLTIITWAVSAVRRAEVELTYQVERVVNKIIAVSSGTELPIDHLVKMVSETVANETHFEQVSVYIDGFSLGRTSQPHRILMRVFERGYKKNTGTDVEISFEDGRGKIMLEAIRTGKVIFRMGPDGAWYCVVPIGSLACINLSDHSKNKRRTAGDSHAVIQRLQPAIKLLEDKLLAANLQRNVFLQRLKAKKGFGVWPTTFGVVRIDIEDSSRETTKFQIMNNGRDVYGEFVNGNYIPALMRALNGYAELEEQIGNELYLIVLPELSGLAISVEECTAKAVEKFIVFAQGDGAKLCNENGFEPLSWVGGATFGQGTLICDEFKVRTSGTPANLIKRLQDCAKRGTILVDDKIVALMSPDSFELGEAREYLVKKDRVSARTVYYRLTTSKSA